jgi:hypothetical protein
MFRLSIAFVLAALALPAAALAKGPSEGSISGPGFVKVVKVVNDGSGGTPGGDLTQTSGFFPAAFGQSPDPMLHRRPASLGPRYTIVWTVPSGVDTADHLRQELYPYAKGGAVSYMKPGQPIFGMTTHGGWYRAAGLKRTLVSLGLPAKAPGARSGGSSWTLPAGLAAAGLVVAAAVLLLWRRQRGQRSPSTSSTELPAGSRT